MPPIKRRENPKRLGEKRYYQPDMFAIIGRLERAKKKFTFIPQSIEKMAMESDFEGLANARAEAERDIQTTTKLLETDVKDHQRISEWEADIRHDNAVILILNELLADRK